MDTHDEPLPGWTIDELAALTEVPSRTIREYQRLGLLPPPERRGRVGRYGPEHRARLSIIGRLQERGYSLAAIGDLMGSWERGRGLGSVLGVDANPAVLDESPTELTEAQLVGMVPALADPDLLERAISVGLLHDDEGSMVVRSLAALELIDLAIESGLPPDEAIEMVDGVRVGAAAIAAAAIDPFVEHLWPRRDEIDVAGMLSRARLLMAQTSASLVVHELGVALSRSAQLDDTGEFDSVIDRVAIGQIRHLSDGESSAGKSEVAATA